jgi:putative phage-type endonuclease
MKTLFGESIIDGVLDVMKVSQEQAPQRSPAWLKKRYEFLTASEVASTIRLIKHEIDLRDAGVFELPPEKKVGQTIPAYNSYAALLRKKCEPPMSGSSIGSIEMQWGVAYEDVVVSLYQVFNEVTIHEFNLIPHPTIPFIAASPDGITSDGTMIEIKCPYSRKPSGLPKIQYWIQMQQQMECCNMEQCDFIDVVIREYGCRDAYIEDCYGDSNVPKNESDPNDHGFIYGRTASGNPKGIMIERNIYDPITDRNSYKYYYAPVLHFESEEEENTWLEEWATQIYGELDGDSKRILNVMTRGNETYNIRYWYVEEWNCVRVKRDREWFKKRYPDLKNFWDVVQKCRAEGIPAELPGPVSHDQEDAPFKRNPSMVRTVSRPRVPKEPKPTTSADCLFLEDD